MTPVELVKLALAEDMPSGDVTTESLDLTGRAGLARIVAKEDLVVSGTEPFGLVWKLLDPAVQVKWQFQDGQMAWNKQTIALVQGPLGSMLKGERTALNFLGRLSGIATLTKCFVTQVEHTACKILDTRKTTPLLRDLEKAAVRHGGGHNHRRDLSERVLIKDNHLRAAGGVRAAIHQIRRKTQGPIEVECATLAEVDEAVEARVDWILLDNFNDEGLKAALARIPAHIHTEASGNMKLERVRRVAEMGVQAISVGQLTHSAPVADISLEMEL
jgi:nicotinate-nucleotide pyrophosphorylase (carboxylating)